LLIPFKYSKLPVKLFLLKSNSSKFTKRFRKDKSWLNLLLLKSKCSNFSPALVNLTSVREL
jgi:hypothetical protein